MSRKLREITVILAALIVMVLCVGIASSAYAAQSGTFPNSACTWEISDDGTLTISGPGTLPNSSDIGGNPPKASNIQNYFPYYQHRADIKKVVIEDGVVAAQNIRGMFHNMPNLTEAVLSGLDATNARSAHDMFSECKNLKKITFPGTFALFQGWRLCQNCTSLEEIVFGTKNDPFDMTSITERSGSWPFQQFDGNASTTAPAFKGCTSLKTLTMKNAVLENGNMTAYMGNLFKSFNNANSEMKTINMDGSTLFGANANGPLRNIYKLSTLETLNLNNAVLTDSNLRFIFQNETTGGSLVPAATELKYLNMSGTKFVVSDNNLDAYQMFQNLNLVKVDLSDADFGDTYRFRWMFRNCKKLVEVDMSGDVNVDEAVRMDEMFVGCTALKTLDVSGFGELPSIVNMDGFVSGCTALEVLNISNMDNSRIQPQNANHLPYDSDTHSSLKVDWGRNLKLDTCTSLKWLIADGSKVWMTTNKKGNPGDEYFNAAVDKSGAFYYFSKNQMDLYKTKPADLENPGDALVKLETRRDYVDLMTDRHETGSRASGETEDANNVNMKKGHLNTSGEGFLAPITYHLLGVEWTTPPAPVQNTFYFIDEEKLAAATPTVTVKEGVGLSKNSSNTGVITEERTKAAWEANTVIGDGTDALITLTYPDIAMDINGGTHDVVIKVNKVTFTNLDEEGAFKDRPTGRQHDNNYYINDPAIGGSYYRDILSYGKGKLKFNNYAKKNTTSGTVNVNKGHAGTDIDFSIEVDDALPNTSILFYIDDLDIPANQEYTLHATDGDFDKLDWNNVTYAGHSEGVVLREGNDIDTLKYAKHTGLVEDNKKVGSNSYTYVHGTGTDPSGADDTTFGSTRWSAFSVKSDATKSNYTWTSGIGCTTDFLNPTPGIELEDVMMQPDASKSVNNKVPTGDYAKGFTFNLRRAKEVTSVEHDGKTLNNAAGTALDKNLDGADDVIEVKNDGDGIDFGKLYFAHPKTEGNTAYIYRIEEVVPNVTGNVLSYNKSHVTYFLKVIVSNPQSDIEMEKGVKAEATIGRYYSDATDDDWKDEWDDNVDPSKIIWDSWSKTMWTADAKERGNRWQENRYVPYPANSTAAEDQYPVKRDQNKVEYIAVPAGKYYPQAQVPESTVYLDANNPYSGEKSVLIETVEGDVYPYDEQNDVDWKEEHNPDKVLSKAIKVDDKQVYVDVHGKMYIKDGLKYYEVTKSGDNYTKKDGELTVEDGKFNPDSRYDRELETDWIINGNPVCEDYQGQKYYKVSDGVYKEPGTDKDLVLGTVGKVMPRSSDKNVTKDKTAGAILVINDNSGNTHVVYETASKKLYYRDNGSGSDNYYSVMHTILNPGVDGFDPATTDKPHETDFDIMVDDKNTEDESDDVYYYRSDNKYFIYAPEDPDKNGKEIKKSEMVNPGDVDHTIINIGHFNNKVKKSNITIEKKVIDGTGADAGRSGIFDFIIEFKNGAGEATDIDLSEFQFAPATSDSFEKLSTGKYKFSLSENQKVIIYEVPFSVSYTVTEALDDGQGQGPKMNMNGWELVKIDSLENYDPDNPDRKVKDTVTNSRSVTRSITTEDEDFFVHTFSNRFTEVLVDKVVNVPSDVDQKEFVFNAEVNAKGLRPNENFTYGYMDEDQNRNIYMGKADASGEAKFTIAFTLNDFDSNTDEDPVDKRTISLIVPQGSTVKVTETEDPDYLTKVGLDNADLTSGLHITHRGKEVQAGEHAGVVNPYDAAGSGKPEIHFENTYVKPVDLPKNSIQAEKELKGRSWRGSDKFDVELVERSGAPVPKTTKEDPENPGETITVDDTNVVISNEDTASTKGYKEGFGAITYTLKDMKKTDGSYEKEKTFEYDLRELDADVSTLVEDIPGVTYSNQLYRVEVKVKLDDETDPDAPELKIESCKIYELNDQEKGDEVSIATFTNTYDVDETIHRMTAWKWLTDADTGKRDETLTAGAFKFILKPIGTNAAKAPMPKDSQGEGAGRTYTATNRQTGFIDMQHATDMTDGLKFNYQELLEAGFTDAELHSDTGVEFEYEVYEKIPDDAVNNNDGTWMTYDASGNVTVYDGIHHSRKIYVKVITDSTSGDPVLSVASRADMGSGDFWYDKNGNKKDVSEIPDYKDEDHHMEGGAPKFHNYYFKQKYNSIMLEKVWDDDDNRDKIRPDSVTVHVSNSTETVDKDVEVPGDGTVVEVKDLPVYKFDVSTKKVTKIKYTIEEKEEGVITGDAKTGYKAGYNHTMPIVLKPYDSADPNKFDIKVTNTHTPKPGEMSGDETYGLKGKPQTGIPDYDVNPNNHVTPTRLNKPDKEGATISDDHKTVTIPGEGTYVLNNDGKVTFTPEDDFVGDPTPVEVMGTDEKGTHVTATYTPHVIDPKEDKDISRTVHFKYESKEGADVTDKVVQKGTLTRKAEEVDPKTGEVTKWGDWDPVTFPAVKNPDKEAGPGWYTNDSIKELIVNEPGDIDDEYVVYQKEHYTVKFENGEHGKSTGGTADKTYGETPQDNTVTPDKGYAFTGTYKYVITDKDGKVVDSGTTSDPKSMKVTGNMVFTPVYEPAKSPAWIEASPVKTVDKVRKVQTGTLTFRPGSTDIVDIKLIDPNTGEVTDATSVKVYQDGKLVGTYKLNKKGKVQKNGTVTYDITFTPNGDFTGKPPRITARAFDANGLYADGIYQPRVIGSKEESEAEGSGKEPGKTIRKIWHGVKTGDESSLYGWLMILIIALGTMTGALVIRKIRK